MISKGKGRRVLAAAAALAIMISAQSALAADGEKTLVPVGKTVGMKINSDGIIVSDISPVKTERGEVYPAREAGLKKGDVILTADGEEPETAEELSEIISESDGRPVRLAVRRGESELDLSLTPAKSQADDRYKAGLWIRDSVAGIGTVTYYDPETETYGALGHGVSDGDTGVPMVISGGEIVSGEVTGAVKGERGEPGMLKGKFLPDDTLGTIEINTNRGVFGHMDEDAAQRLGISVKAECLARPHKGQATIISTVTSGAPEEYSVDIQAVYPDSGERNMLISVTDPDLIELTGGIVQGMSGSPIIQDGKLVGAVTHVLVNDPTMGYGIFIENMLDAAS